jgi:hypothetical protein
MPSRADSGKRMELLLILYRHRFLESNMDSENHRIRILESNHRIRIMDRNHTVRILAGVDVKSTHATSAACSRESVADRVGAGPAC